MKIRETYIYLAIFTICVASRLPALLNQNLLLDGDECIVGLMARHLHSGRDIAMYFYGQQYGLSIVETSLISLFYSFAPPPFAVKAAMLLLWSSGILCFYRTLVNLSPGNRTSSIAITLLFIAAPSWAAWSMKARGGYLTAFVCTNSIMMLATATTAQVAGRWVLIGVMLAVISQAQPIFLPALVPLLLTLLATGGNLKKAALFLSLGLLSGGLLFIYLRLGLPDFYQPGVFNFNSGIISNLYSLPGFVFTHFTGYYYLSNPFPAPTIIKVAAIALCIACALVLLASGVHLVRRRAQTTLLAAATCGVFATLGYSLFRDGDNYRYLLPLTGAMLLLAFLLCVQYGARRLPIILSYTIGLIGLIAVFTFRNANFEKTDAEHLKRAIGYLAQNGVTHCFSGGLLQWQLMFYSDERIICRYVFPTDRYPPYIHEVNSVFQKQPQKTAWINYTQDSASPDSCVTIGVFSIRIQPSRKFLDERSYRFVEN